MIRVTLWIDLPSVHSFHVFMHVLSCFYLIHTTVLEEAVRASPVGVLMGKQCEAKNKMFFSLASPCLCLAFA